MLFCWIFYFVNSIMEMTQNISGTWIPSVVEFQANCCFCRRTALWKINIDFVQKWFILPAGITGTQVSHQAFLFALLITHKVDYIMFRKLNLWIFFFFLQMVKYSEQDTFANASNFTVTFGAKFPRNLWILCNKIDLIAKMVKYNSWNWGFTVCINHEKRWSLDQCTFPMTDLMKPTLPFSCDGILMFPLLAISHLTNLSAHSYFYT